MTKATDPRRQMLALFRAQVLDQQGATLPDVARDLRDTGLYGRLDEAARQDLDRAITSADNGDAAALAAILAELSTRDELPTGKG